MPIRASTYYEKKAKRLKARLDLATETRQQTVKQAKLAKDHATEVVTSLLSQNRRLKETVAEQSVTLSEQRDQLAIQHRQYSEMAHDTDRATKLCAEAVAKHNRMVQAKNEWDRTVNEMAAHIEGIERDLCDARRSVGYRLWFGFQAWKSNFMLSLRCRRSRIINRFMVWRLNAARVDAIKEAGYIPEGLIHMAHKYWEADQKRIELGHEWKYSQDAKSEVKAHHSFWRRLRIYLGRA